MVKVKLALFFQFSAQLTIEKNKGKEKENAELRQAGVLLVGILLNIT